MNDTGTDPLNENSHNYVATANENELIVRTAEIHAAAPAFNIKS